MFTFSNAVSHSATTATFGARSDFVKLVFSKMMAEFKFSLKRKSGFSRPKIKLDSQNALHIHNYNLVVTVLYSFQRMTRWLSILMFKKLSNHRKWLSSPPYKWINRFKESQWLFSVLSDPFLESSGLWLSVWGGWAGAMDPLWHHIRSLTHCSHLEGHYGL